MKLVRQLLLGILIVALAAMIAYPIYLQVQLDQSRKNLFDALSMLQKAFVIAKYETEKQELNRTIRELDQVETLLREYRSDELDELSRKVLATANKIMDARKSAVLSGAHIAQLIGDISYLEGGTRETEAQDNMKIRSGDVLTLKKGAGCEIIFIDGSTATFRYPAAVVFHRIFEDKAQQRLAVEMELKRGELVFSASKITDYSPDFSIQAGKAVVHYSLNAAGTIVRNTALLNTSISCTEGTITVTTGEQELVLRPQELLRIADGSGTLEKFTLPPMPMAEQPANFKKIDRSVMKNLTFKWSPVYSAAGYDFELSDNPVFANPMVSRKGYSGTSLTLPTPEAGVYYWRVAALNNVNERGRYSDIREFKVVENREQNLLVDKQPPAVTLEPVRVFGTTAIVKGKTEPGAVVTVNNKLVEVDPEGGFTAIITLYQSGRNRIEVIARDSSDNETVVEKWVSIKIY